MTVKPHSISELPSMGAQSLARDGLAISFPDTAIEPDTARSVYRTPAGVRWHDKDQATSLMPGVYYGALNISGNSSVTLLPGIYIVKDGPFHVGGTSSITGSGVTLFLSGLNAVMNVSKQTKLDLSAPASGPTSGMLIFEDRLNKAGQQDVIQSRNAPNMLGTIYLPKGKLNIGLKYGGGGAGIAVAQSSAWTVVVAQSIAIHDDMQIMFNTYYDATTVKPPAGLGEKKPEIGLTD